MFCRLSHDQDAGAHDEDRATKSSALTLMTEGFPAVDPQKPWESFDIEEWLHIGALGWFGWPRIGSFWVGERGSGASQSGPTCAFNASLPGAETPDLLFAGICRLFSAQVSSHPG